MISLPLARQLKDAGLTWRAQLNDFFAIPDRGMDERIFVLSNLQSNLDIFRGWPVVTFHGSAEWALDYILTTEVVWLPREDQIREVILSLYKIPELSLEYKKGIYKCIIHVDGQVFDFHDANAGNAYAKSLLFLFEQNGDS